MRARDRPRRRRSRARFSRQRARAHKALTRRSIDAGIRATRADGKARKLADGRGLLLYVSKTGGTLWRYRFRIKGVETQITLGSWPEHDIDEARHRHVEARRLVLDGVNPAERRRADAAEARARETASARARTTVAELCASWLASPEAASWAPTHERAVRSRLDVHLLADPLAALAVADVRPAGLSPFDVAESVDIVVPTFA